MSKLDSLGQRHCGFLRRPCLCWFLLLMALFTAAQGHHLYQPLSYRDYLVFHPDSVCVYVWRLGAHTHTDKNRGYSKCEWLASHVAKQKCLLFGCMCRVGGLGWTSVQNLLVCLSLHLQILLLWNDATGMQYKLSLPPSPLLQQALSPTYPLPALLLQCFFLAPGTHSFSLSLSLQFPAESLRFPLPFTQSKSLSLGAFQSLFFFSPLLPRAKCFSVFEIGWFPEFSLKIESASFIWYLYLVCASIAFFKSVSFYLVATFWEYL